MTLSKLDYTLKCCDIVVHHSKLYYILIDGIGLKTGLDIERRSRASFETGLTRFNTTWCIIGHNSKLNRILADVVGHHSKHDWKVAGVERHYSKLY